MKNYIVDYKSWKDLLQKLRSLQG